MISLYLIFPELYKFLKERDPCSKELKAMWNKTYNCILYILLKGVQKTRTSGRAGLPFFDAGSGFLKFCVA